MNDEIIITQNPEVLEAIERGQKIAEELNIINAYDICRICIEQLEKIGWTAEFDLSGELFDLEKISEKT